MPQDTDIYPQHINKIVRVGHRPDGGLAIDLVVEARPFILALTQSQASLLIAALQTEMARADANGVRPWDGCDAGPKGGH